MNPNDLITQVHNDEDDHHDQNSHRSHPDDQPTQPSRWQRFMCCFSCRSKKTPAAVRMSSKTSPHSNNIPYANSTISPHNKALNHNVNNNSNNSQNASNYSSMNTSTTTKLPTTHPQIPLSSPPLLTSPSALPPGKFLLPPLSKEDMLKGKKTLVLDLDETLVHSSFKPIPNADFVLSIDLEGNTHRVYVRKRPGVDHFLRHCAERYEVVVFTASLAKYADPLLDILDRDHTIDVRFFRDACVQHYNNYIKDLTHLGRKIEHVIIIDNSPFSYMFQPENAIPITSWFNDKNDRQLYDLLPHLDQLAECDDIITLLAQKKLQFVNGMVICPG
jgi:RNA polymerase II subunit A small phosphatase-like protein